MPYKFSRCICLQVPDKERAREFYQNVMGLELSSDTTEGSEFKAGNNRLFLDEGEQLGPIMEFIVPDAEAAKDELLQQGCEVVREVLLHTRPVRFAVQFMGRAGSV